MEHMSPASSAQDLQYTFDFKQPGKKPNITWKHRRGYQGISVLSSFMR